MIFYLGTSSFVGFYAMPVFAKIRPKRRKTSLSHLIANSLLILILTSALPLLSRILGESSETSELITKFNFLFHSRRHHELRSSRRLRRDHLARELRHRPAVQLHLHRLDESLRDEQVHDDCATRAGRQVSRKLFNCHQLHFVHKLSDNKM